MDWLTGKKDESHKWIQQLSDPSRRNAAANELLRLGPAAVSGLIETLNQRDESMRTLAAQILTRLGPSALPALTQALASAHPLVRGRVTEILGEIRHPGALPALTQAARGEYYTVRAGAATALAKIADATAVPVLIELLGDGEPAVRAAAARALGPFGDERCLIRLSDVLLEDHEIEVRQAAAEGLGESQLAGAMPYLVEALQDSFWWYERDNAARPLLEAIEKFGPRIVDILVGALSNKERTVRKNAAVLLGRIGDARAIEPLGMMVYDLHDEVGVAAAQALTSFGAAALDVLSEALAHPEAAVRMNALEALSKIEEDEVVDLIAELLHDADRRVQKQAVESLGNTRNPRAIKLLEPVAADRSDRELSLLAREASRRVNM